MSYYLDHRDEAALLLLGGAATAISIALARQANYVIGIMAAVVGLTVLFAAGKVMLDSADWGSVVLGDRDRRNALLAAIGFLAVGMVVMWLGFGPLPSLPKVGLVAGGCVVFLCGVVALTIWLYVRSYMAGSDHTG